MKILVCYRSKSNSNDIVSSTRASLEKESLVDVNVDI